MFSPRLRAAWNFRKSAIHSIFNVSVPITRNNDIRIISYDYEAKRIKFFFFHSHSYNYIFARSRSSAHSSSRVFNDAATLKHPWRAAFCRQKLVGRYAKLVKCDASQLSTLLSSFRLGSLTIDDSIIADINQLLRTQSMIARGRCKSEGSCNSEKYRP